ncbi:MFS transporter [Lentilactobacillus otakiensis]|uniref:Transporter, major facilitator family protein n=1 Tax=Lentilactobacillus otakiensis DSM 19908 = JCM 15040 TaxID=1423780 RepID=S4NN83_9LACO|nr:MFS transporter [Lentilactobacillus otakiensis]KRL10965.1 transporter, major facilitator family protein [Lentilactobacillus otakiensis DSM 19908 = JCM 15040]MBZ3777198.1 MFS transporter [Lentilactobacillus otakiensis]MDV3517795.1 MFS transporter [Lentilactobacillus otakiensis]GAD17306.1 transporter, major facilitator family protein [Lentilactobacillus otakiensis DSM 19908 = JCM 15040]
MKTNYASNINKGYTYSFLSWFGITSLWVMYLQTKGLTLVEIGLCESIFHIASFLFEVPSGVLADRLTYKFDLVIGRLAAILSAVIILFGQTFWLFALGFVINALSYNMQSGTLEALLYDSLVKDDLTKKYPKVISHIDVIIEFADTLGVVLAGLLIHWYFELTYVIGIVVGVMGLITVLFFKEPVIKKRAVEKPTSVKSIVVNSYRTMKGNHQLRNLMLFDALYATVCTSYFFYFQTLMETNHFSGWLISVLMVMSALLNIIGIQLTPMIQKKFSKRELILALSVSLVCLLMLTWLSWLPILIVMFLISQLLPSLITPIFSSYYNEMISSEERATLLSVANVLFSAVMIIAFPLLGWLIQMNGFSFGFGLVGCALAVVLIVMRRSFVSPK